MRNGLTINDEMTAERKKYFTVSGKDGNREYYRLGYFDTKANAQKVINQLLEYKTRKDVDDDFLD